MSDTKETGVEEQVQVEETVDEKSNVDVSEGPQTVEKNEGQAMPTPEEEVILVTYLFIADVIYYQVG